MRFAHAPLAFVLWVCALPGADAQRPCGPQDVPASRYQDNGDGTLTDKRSQLMWMRCSAGQSLSGGRCTGPLLRLDWQSAQAAAGHVNGAGSFFFNDWRLPQLRELATIAELHCTDPRLDTSAFPDTPPAAYWTQSVRAGESSSGFAFALSFGAAGISYDDKQAPRLVRLVRNAP